MTRTIPAWVKGQTAVQVWTPVHSNAWQRGSARVLGLREGGMKSHVVARTSEGMLCKGHAVEAGITTRKLCVRNPGVRECQPQAGFVVLSDVRSASGSAACSLFNVRERDPGHAALPPLLLPAPP